MSRIRANKITNQAANGAPVCEQGLIVTGILTATGNISVGGTLTYEDVTNVDSVGVITARSTIDAQGDVSIVDKIIHSGDANTAIRFPAADTISFETAGTERLRIDSSGLIGIGLSVYSNTSASEYDGDANNLVVGTGSGNEGITILSGQNVSNYGSIFFADGTGATNSKRGQLRYEQNNEVMSFYTAGTEKVRINAAGNVGIGTDNPSAKLDVYGNSNLNGDLEVDGQVGIGTNEFYDSTTKLEVKGRINTVGSASTGSLNYGNGTVVNVGSLSPHNLQLMTGNYTRMRFENGTGEALRIGSAGQLGIAGANYGTAGQVLASGGSSAAPSWSGGSTRVLEYFSVPCTGESVDTSYGTRTTTSAGTAGYQLTTSWVDIVGSQITYRPPTGTHTVIYRFAFQLANHDADAIGHFKFFVGSDEILWARHTHRADDYQNRAIFEWPIRIDSANANNFNHGRLQTWNSDLVLKMQARDYSGSYDMKIHMVNNWDGGGTDQFSMPTISVTALGI